MADEPDSWWQAQSLQSEIRANLNAQKDQLGRRVLKIGDRIAKVVYNGTKAADCFDESSAYFLCRDLQMLALTVDDGQFSQKCWNILTENPGEIDLA